MQNSLDLTHVDLHRWDCDSRFQVELRVQQDPKKRAVNIYIYIFWLPKGPTKHLDLPLASWDPFVPRTQSGITLQTVDTDMSGPCKESVHITLNPVHNNHIIWHMIEATHQSNTKLKSHEYAKEPSIHLITAINSSRRLAFCSTTYNCVRIWWTTTNAACEGGAGGDGDSRGRATTAAAAARSSMAAAGRFIAC